MKNYKEMDEIIYEEETHEVEDLIPIEVDDEAGMSTGAAFAIGALVTAGAIFIGKKAVEGGKKLWSKHQEKKAEAAKAKEAEETQTPEAPADEAPATENA